MNSKYSKIKCRRALIFIFLAGLVTHPAWGQDQTITSERPQETKSSETVGKNRLQVESGFTYTHDNFLDIFTWRTFTFPTLIRFGILEPLELRVGGDMYHIRKTTDHVPSGRNDFVETGFADLVFGAKARFLKNEGWRPSLGALFEVRTPTGQAPFRADGWDSSFTLLADWKLPGRFSVGTNLGLLAPKRYEVDGRLLFTCAYGVGVGYTPSFWEERLRLFLESAGFVAFDDDFPDLHKINTGFRFALRPNLQLDSFVRFGLSTFTPEWATGLGVSWKF